MAYIIGLRKSFILLDKYWSIEIGIHLYLLYIETLIIQQTEKKIILYKNIFFFGAHEITGNFLK